MSSADPGEQPLLLRPFALFLLTIGWFIGVVTCIAFLKVRENFPPWFAAPFVGAAVAMLLVALLYYWQLSRADLSLSPPGKWTTAATWFLVVCSVLCTSALHQFYPFRTDVFSLLPATSHWFTLIGYNFILTAGSLAAVIALAVLYYLGLRRAALAGLLLLAAVMLIPNDDCGNDFNLPWIRLIGASPLMFAPNAGVLLIGYSGLQGIIPRVSLAIMAAINLFVLFLGLGHLTRIIW